MSWLLWAVMLLAQNASFTAVSRARNSGSLVYHGVASVLSNGTYILALMLTFDRLQLAIKSGDPSTIMTTAGFYTLCTVVGSLSTHAILLKFVERGNMKVGG